MNRGGKFLRPPTQSANFDSSSDDDSDEDEIEEPSNNLNNRTQANSNSANLSSSEDDDDDDDDDEPPSSSNKRSRGYDDDHNNTKKKSKKNTSSYFDIEAEDDGDEDEDEPYGTHYDPHDRVKRHYTAEDVQRENMDEEAMEIIRRQNLRRERERMLTGETDVEEVARQLEERHRQRNTRVDRIDDGSIAEGTQNLSAVSQQSLLPSVSDPRLWMFSCPNGKERELVVQLMNKCIAYAKQGKPLGITSAVAAQSKGKLYIESYSEPAVREAVQGVRGIMAYSMRMVPINDMTTVMTVIPKKKPVKKNEWVRMTRGHFKGDLAFVKAVRDNGLKCIVQCVPRIDLTLLDLPPEEAKIRRKTVRPAQKFLNAQEIGAMGKEHTRMRFAALGDMMCDYFEGNYYHDGYLLKEVTVGTMVKPCGEDEPPTLDELQRFLKRNSNENNMYDGDEEAENEASREAKSLLDKISELQGKISVGKSDSDKGGLIIGDTVEIIEGDLIGMKGKLLSIDGSTVKVKPETSDLGDTTEVDFLISQVKKHIEVGAQVKVTTGRYANETGIVVNIEKLEGENDSTAVILTHLTQKEISVRVSQIQESAEVASGQDKLAGYELHDLVVLSGGGSTNEVGVIVRVGREEFTVINNHGISREVRPEELRGKRNAFSNRAVALDVQGNQIRVGDTVNIEEGPHKGKSATIKRMNRAQLFLYSQNRTENAGIFVVRSRSCVLAGNKVHRSTNSGGDSPYGTPRTQSNVQGPGRGRKDDNLIGKTVRIQNGNWKGYIGTVSDATPTHVQVELHSRLKKVMVAREKVAVAGDKFGATEVADRPMSDVNIIGATPMHGGATPMHGGATPMHGGATPMHGGATPLHDGLGGFTPSHNGGNDDVWRPGGSIDRPAEDDNDDWGSSASSPITKQDPFSSSSTDTGGGWGSSGNDQSGGTWAPSTSDGQQSNDTTSAPSTDNRENNDISRYGSGIDASTMGAADGEEAPVWFMERVCVQLKKNNETAIIKETNNNVAVVEIEKDNSSATIHASDCTMVAPKEHDTVLVTGGADVGVEGELICIDGTDAILKEYKNEDFKIVDLVHLAKIVGDSN